MNLSFAKQRERMLTGFVWTSSTRKSWNCYLENKTYNRKAIAREMRTKRALNLLPAVLNYNKTWKNHFNVNRHFCFIHLWQHLLQVLWTNAQTSQKYMWLYFVRLMNRIGTWRPWLRRLQDIPLTKPTDGAHPDGSKCISTSHKFTSKGKNDKLN